MVRRHLSLLYTENAALAESQLLSRNGFAVRMTDYSCREGDGGCTYVHLDFHSTYAVYAGVQKVVLDNGAVRTLDPSEVPCFECVVQ